MVAQTKPEFSPDEYLALEREASTKSEYLNGGIYAMTGGTPKHSEIASNIIMSIGLLLKRKQCHVYTSDLRIASANSQLITYPDVSIVCGEPQFRDTKNDVVTNPIVLIEVLSDSTEAYDRGKKFNYYRTIESLQDYILVSQQEPLIDLYSREPNGSWRIQSIAGLDPDGEVIIPSINCQLLLADVYDGIEFTEAQANGDGDSSQILA
jgi:Uma2 family endonuclease